MRVPFVDLRAQYSAIAPAIHEAIESVLQDCQFIQGPHVAAFEAHFVSEHGGRQAVGCANGTSALTVALRCLGVGPGDEVITVNNTFFATVEAIVEVGARPVLVDCDPIHYGLDLADVERKLSARTKAVIPVHLYGNPVDMPALSALARQHKLLLVEDCAQAHLASLAGRAIGTFGDLATFSFFPGKNLGAYGDAGLVLVNREELLPLVRKHVNHGRIGKYDHELCAGNFRMDGLQAAILDVKLRYLREWTRQRQAHALRYDEALKPRGFKVLEPRPGAECVYHLYEVELSNREAVQRAMAAVEIETGIHYPTPLSRQPALAGLGHRPGDFPVSERVAQRILSLPLFPELTAEQQDLVLVTLLGVAEP